VPEKYDSNGHSYRLGPFEDDKRHLVMRQPIAPRCPARLLRGMCDNAGSWRLRKARSFIGVTALKPIRD